MDLAHLHLILNHIPIVGILIGFFICIASFIFKDRSISRIALIIFIFSAVVAIPAFLTGEAAEEKVEHLPGILESSIGRHEDIAYTYIWMTSILGMMALIALVTDVVKRSYATKFMYALTFTISLVTLITSYQLGNSGGQIRHHEVSVAPPNINKEWESD